MTMSIPAGYEPALAGGTDMQTAPGEDYADIAGSSSLCATHAQSKLGTTRRSAQFHEVGYLQGVPERAAASTLGSRWRTSTHCPSPSVKVAWELTLSAAGGIGWTVGTQPMVHPAATDCSPCRGNRSRSPRRPSVANATGAHTGLASIAGPVLILISGAHRVDTAMVAANLRVRRLRRAAAGHAAGAAVQCDRSDCLEVERDPQLGAHLSFSIRGGLPLLLSIGLCPGPGRRIGCSACSHASCRFCLD